jgi:transposase
LTGREWELIAPLLPLAKRGGRPRTTDLRAVTDAILYIASSGCQWRMLPKDFYQRTLMRTHAGDSQGRENLNLCGEP